MSHKESILALEVDYRDCKHMAGVLIAEDYFKNIERKRRAMRETPGLFFSLRPLC